MKQDASLILTITLIQLITINGNGNEHRNLSFRQFVKENCFCLNQWQCECCATINKNTLNTHQKLCTDWIISTKQTRNILMNIHVNGNILYRNAYSLANIPPFCMPIMPALALTGCIQIHNIDQQNWTTVHGCANVTLNFITTILINQFIGCLDISPNGIQAVDANHNVIHFPPTDKPPNVELVTVDLKTTTIA